MYISLKESLYVLNAFEIYRNQISFYFELLFLLTFMFLRFIYIFNFSYNKFLSMAIYFILGLYHYESIMLLIMLFVFSSFATTRSPVMSNLYKLIVVNVQDFL